MFELGVCQPLDDCVGDVTDPTLQGQQIFWQSSSVDFVSEEIDQICSNALGHGIRGGVWGDFISCGGLDDGDDSVWVYGDGVQAAFVVYFDVRVGDSVRRVDWHIDVVDALEGRSCRVDFYDDLVCDTQELRGAAHGGPGDDGPVFFDGGGFDDHVVEYLVVGALSCVEPVGEVLWEHGQMFVEELDLSRVDGFGDWLAHLVRCSPDDHVVLCPGVLFRACGGADKQVESEFPLQIVLHDVVDECFRDCFRGAHACEPGPAEVLAVFEVWDQFVCLLHSLQVGSVPDPLFQQLRDGHVELFECLSV